MKFTTGNILRLYKDQTSSDKIFGYGLKLTHFSLRSESKTYYDNNANFIVEWLKCPQCVLNTTNTLF